MPPTKKNLKATKKFEKKHLKGVLEKRKATAKIKQRTQIQAKKQLKKKADDVFYKGDKEAGDGAAAPKPKAKPGAKVSEMSVDEEVAIEDEDGDVEVTSVEEDEETEDVEDGEGAEEDEVEDNESSGDDGEPFEPCLRLTFVLTLLGS